MSYSIHGASTIKTKQSGLADGGRLAAEQIYLNDLAIFYNVSYLFKVSISYSI